MKVTAKCHNYSGCVLAYRGDEIELESTAALVCPECGKPIVLSKGGGAWLKTTLILSGAIILVGGAGAYFALPLLKKKDQPKPVIGEPYVTATPDPRSATPPSATPPKSTATVPAPLSPKVPVIVEQPTVMIAPPKIDTDPSKAENKSVKAEVLTRIDFMPNITQGNKDRLYNSVERARTMGKVLTIQFTSGQTSIPTADAAALKSQLDSQAVMNLRDDPTAVFVILGYADSKGDDKKNLAVSQLRADNVLNVMKDKCKVTNVMHAVAMGSSKLLDANDLDKNRSVEVWAVLP